jgi:ribose 5-phosphate isomerase A
LARRVERQIILVGPGRCRAGNHHQLPSRSLPSPYRWRRAASRPSPAPRPSPGRRAAFITDNGNVILDCRWPIADPERLEMAIHTVPGVVGTGLFVGIAHTVLVGEPSGVKELRRRP